jgi:hypothetical protein
MAAFLRLRRPVFSSSQVRAVWRILIVLPLLFANIDVSIIKIYLDTSILAKSIMDRREYMNTRWQNERRESPADRGVATYRMAAFLRLRLAGKGSLGDIDSIRREQRAV